MGDWSRQTIILAVLGSLAAVFAVMTIWAYSAGTVIVDETIPEEAFEKEAIESPHATFRLTRQTPVELSVDGATLDNSWLWVKAIIADADDKPVADYTFDLSYYSGSDWSEGDPDDYRVLVLPKGKYKLIVYGEDPERSRGWTDESRERLNVTVTRDVVLARYPLAGFIVFLLLGGGYWWWNRETGIPAGNDTDFDFDDDF